MTVMTATARATGTITSQSQVSDIFLNGLVITIGQKTYTFQDTLTDVDGNVHVGADDDATLANLRDAINLGAGAGTDYATSMTVHPQVSCTASGATPEVLTLTARAAGVDGNRIIIAPLLVRATGTITAAGGTDITDTETIVVGNKTYTFNDTLGSSDGDVHVGTDDDESIDFLAAAINLGSGSGTGYAAAMTRNPYVSAVSDGSGVLTVTAIDFGAHGNLIPITIGTSTTAVSGALLTGGTGLLEAAHAPSAAVTSVSGPRLTGGAGDFGTFINELQAGEQLNSSLLQKLEAAEA